MQIRMQTSLFPTLQNTIQVKYIKYTVIENETICAFYGHKITAGRLYLGYISHPLTFKKKQAKSILLCFFPLTCIMCSDITYFDHFFQTKCDLSLKCMKRQEILSQTYANLEMSCFSFSSRFHSKRISKLEEILI